MRVCTTCLANKPLSEFFRDNRRLVPYKAVCKSCDKKRNRTYEKTPQGFLTSTYHNMQCRVRGQGNPRERKHYKGLPILPRATFYAWARENADFWRLFKLWTASGHRVKLAPSVNRLDPDDGYLLGNIEFITHSLNSGLSRHRTDKAFQNIYASVAA